MRRVLLVLGFCAILTVAASSYMIGSAQDAADAEGTPAVCATPQGTPDMMAGSPQATPDIITDASPEVVATSVVENIETGVGEVMCGTPGATPGM